MQLRPLGLPETMTYEGRTWSYLGAEGDVEAVLPEGVRWRFDYPGDQADPIVVVATPSGGQLRYEMHRETFDTFTSPVITKRIVTLAGMLPAEWTYTFVGDITTATRTTTVHSPDFSQTVLIHQFRTFVMSGRALVLIGRIHYDGDTVPFEREEIDYVDLPVQGSWGGIVPGKPVPLVPAIKERRVWREDRWYKTTYSYSPSSFGDYHHANQIVETGELARTTNLSYAHFDTSAIYRVGRLTREAITVGAQTFIRNASYLAATGFQDKEWSHATTDFGGIVTVFTADTYGNVASVNRGDRPGKATTFEYRYGVVSQTSTPMYTIARVINPDGTVASETAAGRTTTFGYDTLGRLTLTQPPASTPTVVEYDPAGAWVRSTRGTSVATTTLDGLGRAAGDDERGWRTDPDQIRLGRPRDSRRLSV